MIFKVEMSGLSQFASHSACPVGIIVIILLKDIGEKEKPEHQEYYGKLEDYYSPQFFADRHIAEAVGI